MYVQSERCNVIQPPTEPRRDSSGAMKFGRYSSRILSSHFCSNYSGGIERCTYVPSREFIAFSIRSVQLMNYCHYREAPPVRCATLASSLLRYKYKIRKFRTMDGKRRRAESAERGGGKEGIHEAGLRIKLINPQQKQSVEEPSAIYFSIS